MFHWLKDFEGALWDGMGRNRPYSLGFLKNCFIARVTRGYLELNDIFSKELNPILIMG